LTVKRKKNKTKKKIYRGRFRRVGCHRGAGIFSRHAHVRRHSRYSQKSIFFPPLLLRGSSRARTHMRNREAYIVISLWMWKWPLFLSMSILYTDDIIIKNCTTTCRHAILYWNQRFQSRIKLFVSFFFFLPIWFFSFSHFRRLHLILFYLFLSLRRHCIKGGGRE
jgi:hypothetical protein